MNMTADEIARTVVPCLHGACEPLCANQCGIVQVARLALAEGRRQAFEECAAKADFDRLNYQDSARWESGAEVSKYIGKAEAAWTLREWAKGMSEGKTSSQGEEL